MLHVTKQLECRWDVNKVSDLFTCSVCISKSVCWVTLSLCFIDLSVGAQYILKYIIKSVSDSSVHSAGIYLPLLFE